MDLYRAYVGDDNATDFTRDFIQDRNIYQEGHDTVRELKPRFTAWMINNYGHRLDNIYLIDIDRIIDTLFYETLLPNLSNEATPYDWRKDPKNLLKQEWYFEKYILYRWGQYLGPSHTADLKSMIEPAFKKLMDELKKRNNELFNIPQNRGSTFSLGIKDGKGNGKDGSYNIGKFAQPNKEYRNRGKPVNSSGGELYEPSTAQRMKHLTDYINFMSNDKLPMGPKSSSVGNTMVVCRCGCHVSKSAPCPVGCGMGICVICRKRNLYG
jgi:hypothetical protein